MLLESDGYFVAPTETDDEAMELLGKEHIDFILRS